MTPRAQLVLAPNPGPMTLDGTNTWVLREPGGRRAVVVDPGPADAGHLRRVAEAAGPVGLVLLTHGHPDHAEGARDFAAAVHAPVLAADSRHRLGTEGLSTGQVLECDGLVLRVVATPGHSADSVSFQLPADAAVLTGDTVLGRGTTVVAHPDGRLADYLRSLAELAELAAAGARVLLPGHGPVVADAAGWVAYYQAHRAERLAEVRAALAAGDRTPAQIVRRVYADVDERLWPAAQRSVAAALDYLAGDGR